MIKSPLLSSLLLLALLPVLALAEAPGAFRNLSTRGVVGASAGSLIGGFYVSGETSKTVLIRGVGPGLLPFGITNAAGSINIRIYDSTGALIGSNNGIEKADNAGAVVQAAEQVGAFTLTDSGDAAMLITLAPSASYTVEVLSGDVDAADGTVLLEVYDVDAPEVASHLSNMSTRAQVGANAGAIVSGFVISGNMPKSVLIRGVGASLTALGVPNAAAGTSLTIFDSAGNVVVTNQGQLTEDETATLAATTARVGAFPLSDAADSAVLVSLAPGAYTVQISPATADAADGVGLVEIYEADLPVTAE